MMRWTAFDMIMAIIAIVAISATVLVVNCAAPRSRLGTVDHNQVRAEVAVSAELSAALLRLERLEATLAKIQMGDIAVGGNGDSIITWILAVGVILATPAGGLFYQHVLRPPRVRRDRIKEVAKSNG